MDGTQAVPDVEEIAVVQPAIWDERLERKHAPAEPLEAIRHARPAPIERTPCIVVGVQPRCGDPSAGLARNGGNIQDVVEMAVGDDDSADWLAVPAAPPQRVPQ